MSLFTGSLTPFSYIVTSLVDIVFLNVFSIYCLLSSFPWILRIFSTYFFIVFKNLFNRKLTTLQYCGGFSHTLTWISLRCTCVPISSTTIPPAPAPPHPSGFAAYLDGWVDKTMAVLTEKGGLSYYWQSNLTPIWQVEWRSLSCIQLFATPWTIQSMKFSRPEYWNA